MAEEIKKSGLTFKEAKNLVDVSIRDVKDGFVATGYYLWIIREERLWEDDGYNITGQVLGFPVHWAV